MNEEKTISQKEFDDRNRRRSWIVTATFHVAVLLLGFLVTCAPVDPPEELTEIQWGGGGGIPGLDAPVGETPEGDPDGGNREADPTERNTSTTERPVSQPRSSQQRPVTRDDPNALPSSQESPSPKETTSKTTETTSSESSSNAGTNNSDNAQGSPDAMGDKPTGGSGGSSVGVGNGNIGRCWQRSPSAVAAGQTTTQSGTVNVTVTVKPDGRVQVGPTSGTASLAGRARTLAGQARACVDLEAGDVTTTLTYRFVAN